MERKLSLNGMDTWHFSGNPIKKNIIDDRHSVISV